MDKKEKLEILRKLDEKRLRQEVLIPLFQKMGFKDVIEYHGSTEKGKDIIYYETDRYGDKDYSGVVVKKDDISGSVSDSSGAMTVLNQIEQTFDEPYTDIYGLKELMIDRCLVITSGDIKNTAAESIRGKLKKSNLDKLVKFFDGNKLVDLLDDYMPDYFFKELECFNT
jgi:restriction endonuclease Mrr